MDPVTQRTRRAAAARVLLSLAENGQLADPDRWDWETLDRLPLWCLFDASKRTQLQYVCGALLLAPEIRLWIDRRRLGLLAEVLGDTCLDRLLSKADALASALISDDVSSSTSLPLDAQREDVARYLAMAGASVMRSTLHPSLPLGSLSETLGESAGELAESVAIEVLLIGESLLDEDGPGAVMQSLPREEVAA